MDGGADRRISWRNPGRAAGGISAPDRYTGGEFEWPVVQLSSLPRAGIPHHIMTLYRASSWIVSLGVV
jgi:hypothetical protein